MEILYRCSVCGKDWRVDEKERPAQCPFCGSYGKRIIQRFY